MLVRTLNVPDTVGYSMPSDWGQKISSLIKNTRNGNSVIWSHIAIMIWEWQLLILSLLSPRG